MMTLLRIRIFSDKMCSGENTVIRGNSLVVAFVSFCVCWKGQPQPTDEATIDIVTPITGHRSRLASFRKQAARTPSVLMGPDGAPSSGIIGLR